MTGLHTRAWSSSPLLHASGHPSGAAEGGEAPGLVQVLRDPYEWKSAVGLALAVFVGSLALAPAPAVDHKKFAAEINTKTLKAAAAVKISTRFAASRPKQSGK